ncbi:MAG: hypothetical protein LH606_05445 [Cytophagaceae bacterium]|nr:hypothetical protein [Cytophagaceae bacterium]
MAKSDQQLLVIDNRGDDHTLSKAQRAFNRFVKRIQALEQDIKNHQQWKSVAHQRAQQEIVPLEQQLADQRVVLVKLLDRQHGVKFFRAAERKRLAELILEQCYDLIEQFGHQELKPIFEKYQGQDFDEANTEADVEIGQAMKDVFAQMFGIEMADDVDVSSPEKLQAYLAQKMAEQQAQAEEAHHEAEQRRASRKKTPKQLAAEERRKTEEKHLSLAVRKVYMDLVKTFHPDREPDEAERQRKTEIMQRVTAAYNDDNLFELLKLQLEFERVDPDHLETLADDQLKAYNKLLKSRVDELEAELFGLRGGTGFGDFESRFVGSPAKMDWSFGQAVKQLKAALRQLEADLRRLEDPAQLREFLKEYGKHQRQREREDFF